MKYPIRRHERGLYVSKSSKEIRNLNFPFGKFKFILYRLGMDEMLIENIRSQLWISDTHVRTRFYQGVWRKPVSLDNSNQPLN